MISPTLELKPLCLPAVSRSTLPDPSFVTCTHRRTHTHAPMQPSSQAARQPGTQAPHEHARAHTHTNTHTHVVLSMSRREAPGSTCSAREGSTCSARSICSLSSTLQTFTPHPTSYILRPPPYTVNPSPCTLHPSPYTPLPPHLHPAPHIDAHASHLHEAPENHAARSTPQRRNARPDTYLTYLRTTP